MAIEFNAVRVSINTNALGVCGGTGFIIPIEEFELGKPLRINPWFPPLYSQYIRPIDLTLTDDGLWMESPYRNASIPLRPNHYLNIDGVGLSYATCDISISLEKSGETLCPD